MCNLGEHLEDVEVAGLLLGALIHDFKHPGKSNAFLTKTGHSLALTYNDVSVLENFHLSEVGTAREGCGRSFVWPSVSLFFAVYHSSSGVKLALEEEKKEGGAQEKQ